MYKFYILLAICIFSNSIFAQSLKDGFNEEFLKMRVKQLDEFVKRFNYETDIEGNPIADRNNVQKRKGYIISLFDYELLINKSNDSLQKYNQFLDAVANPNAPVFLNYHDSNWYAVADCKVKLNGKLTKLRLVLQTEKDKKQNEHWVIRSVRADFLSLQPKKVDDSKFISPVSHELNFMDLHKITTEERANIVHYAPEDFQVDERNVFFYLIKTGQLQIEHVERIVYHFLQVPGFIFTVQHIERDSNNVGWLTSNLMPQTLTQKKTYKSSVLSLNQ